MWLSGSVLHPCRVIVLEDNDVLHLSGGGYGIYNTEGANVEEAVPRVLLTLQMEVEQIMKVGACVIACGWVLRGVGSTWRRRCRACCCRCRWR